MDFNLGSISEQMNTPVTQESLEAKYNRPVKHGMSNVAQIGLAHAQLASQLLNPTTYMSVAKGYKEGKGLVLPGTKYVGPFNQLSDTGSLEGKWTPTSRNDLNAYLHDRAYDSYIKRGEKPRDVYLGFSKADKDLLDKTKHNLQDPDALAIMYGMEAKKLLRDLHFTHSRIR